jgi:hypothetical protein
MKALLACWLTAIAVLVWLAMPQPNSFEKRWPVALPPAMSLQTSMPPVRPQSGQSV